MEITGDKYVVYLYGLNRISRSIMGTDYEGTEYTYDDDGEILSQKDIDRYHEIYLYDGHGNVVQLVNERITDDLFLHWLDTDPQEEFDTNSDVIIDSDDLTLYLKTYPITQSYTYDAFGNQLDEQKVYDTNPFRYCGEYWDSETGEVYLRARYYSPTTGRFSTQDTHWNVDNMIYGDEKNINNNYKEGDVTYYFPNIKAINQSCNLYVYSLNNPIYYIDSTGFKVYIAGASVALDCGFNVSGSGVLVFDDEGNIGVAATGGTGGGIFGASACGIVGIFEDMENINQLEGVGGFVSMTIGEGVVVTGSLNFSDGNIGVLIGAGFGAGSLVDFSGGISFSEVKQVAETNSIGIFALKVAVFGWMGVFI